DCPPENQAVPASPCHNGGTRPAAPPLPEISACRRRKIAHAPDLAVVPSHLNATATTTSRFFERRLSVMTRALGSPKIPRTVCSRRNPENEYVSQSRRLRFAARAIHL